VEQIGSELRHAQVTVAGQASRDGVFGAVDEE